MRAWQLKNPFLRTVSISLLLAGGQILQSAGGASWGDGPDLPIPAVRGVGVYFPANGRFYNMGGRRTDSAGTDLTNPLEYDPDTDTWTTKSATFPDNLVNNMACGVLTVSGTPFIFCVGGSASGGSTATKRVFRYSPVTDTIQTAGDPWNESAAETLPGGFTVFQNKLYILGGSTINVGVTNRIFEFNPINPGGTQWTQKAATLPVALGFIPTTTIGTLIFTAGGSISENSIINDSNHSFVYNPAGDAISSIASIPRATAETRALNIGNEMWVLGGGRTAPNPSNEVNIYNPQGGTWRVGPPFTLARRNFAADTNGTQVFVAGGYVGPSPGTPTTFMEIFGDTKTVRSPWGIRVPAVGTTSGVSNPYPSTIDVSGLTGLITKLSVTIHDFRHRFPDDVDMLLVGPEGQKMVIWSDVGGSSANSTCGATCDNNANPGTTGPTITLVDTASSSLPDAALLASGAFKPTNFDTFDSFAAPAPPPPHNNPAPAGTDTFASTFNGTNPNGTWSLFVVDDVGNDSGRINGGWSLNITGADCEITCPANISVNNNPNECGAIVDYPTITSSGSCGTISSVPATGSFFGKGAETVTVSSASGASCTFTVTVIDTQPPLIACPADVTQQADPGQNSAVVTFPLPTTGDNCAETDVVANPPSGSSFPVGTTTVTSTATDAAGNTATCTFTVTVTPPPTPTPTATPTPTPPLLGNISTRLRVETGDNALIGGFIITGTQEKKILLRALGPSTGVPGALENPILELFGAGSTLIRTNDNWIDAENQQEIIDSTIPPTNDLESAILLSLPSNSSAYTAVVRGVEDGTGIGLVEAYDLDQSVDSRLANISTRGFVQTGDNVMIAGFFVLNGTQKVIVRAIGPSLTVPGKLEDPTMELFDGQGTLLATNDNWRSDQELEIIATTIPPTNDAESAIVQTLAPNSYTAIVRGVNDATGIAVVEVYALN